MATSTVYARALPKQNSQRQWVTASTVTGGNGVNHHHIFRYYLNRETFQVDLERLAYADLKNVTKEAHTPPGGENWMVLELLKLMETLEKRMKIVAEK